MKLKRKNHSIFICLSLLFLVFISLIGVYSPPVNAYAEYSNVLDDLQKDSSFDLWQYPIVDIDHSLKVITIAEGAENELFIYVYQPSASHKATSISISVEAENKVFKLYNLTYLSKYKALYKYVVDDFIVEDLDIRYYEIASIYRDYVDGIDFNLGTGETINEMAFAVGKFYIFSDTASCCYDVEVVEITDKYVGFLRYYKGFFLYSFSCDSHFVAFSTDKQIDKLMEVDITYIASIGTVSRATGKFNIDNTDTFTKTITASDTAVSNKLGLFGRTYSWDRIESVSDFVKNEDLKDSVKNELSNMKWVLRFAETDYVEHNNKYYPFYEITKVSEVAILRLKFESEGKLYNLGVVDNKQTGTGIPVNKNNFAWWEILLYSIPCLLILLIVLLAVFSPSNLIAIIKFIGQCVLWIFKALWWLISWPFKLFTKE